MKQTNKIIKKTCLKCNTNFIVSVGESWKKFCGRKGCFDAPNEKTCEFCGLTFKIHLKDYWKTVCSKPECLAEYRKRKHKFKYHKSDHGKYSSKAIAWLNYISERDNITIYHALNKGELIIPYQRDNQEKYIYADGFCEDTNTVYEFYGDYWHGNPKIYNPMDINLETKKTFKELYEDTLERERIIREKYNLVTIWESEWDEISK